MIHPEFLNDESGKLSMGRLLLATHTVLNWVFLTVLIFGLVEAPESETLNLLIGSLDVTMFIVFGAWVIGPRSFQYLFPQIGATVRAGGALLGRLRGTDDAREDDERGDP